MLNFQNFANESSMLSDFAVDGSDLIVRFRNGGKAYRVEGAAIRAEAFQNADSAGRFYNGELKPFYTINRSADHDL